MCIVHKGFRDFRALLAASILGGKLISLKPAIAYFAYTNRVRPAWALTKGCKSPAGLAIGRQGQRLRKRV